MATNTPANVAALRMSIKQLENKNQELQEKLSKAHEDKDTELPWCHMCNRHMTRDHFYVSTDPNNRSGLTGICKDCVSRIVFGLNQLSARKRKTNGKINTDKEHVIAALRYLDKPFITRLWDASVLECMDETTKTKHTPWDAYIKNIQMKPYQGMTFADSDFLKGIDLGNYFSTSEEEKELDEDTREEFERNRADVIT